MITLRKKVAANTQLMNCRPEDATNDAVRIVSVEMDVVTVGKVNPYYREQMPAYGVIVQKYTPTRCLVQTSGPLSLSGSSSLNPGRVCFVGVDGRLTATPPVATASPSSYVIVQNMGLATTPTKLDFSPDTQTLEIVL